MERQGLPSGSANDWFGVRFKTTPGKIYVVEVEYPDLEFMSASAYLVEPKDHPANGQCRPVTRSMSGVFTGSFLPHDDRLKTMQMAHFASAPWMAACWQNGPHLDRPSFEQVLDPACASRMTLYEVEGDLPASTRRRLPIASLGSIARVAPALSPFGPEKFHGENGNWSDRPDSVYYRHAYPTVANCSFATCVTGATRPCSTGSTATGPGCSLRGLFRRAAASGTSTCRPDRADVEKNGLRVVFNVMANNPLPTSGCHGVAL